MKKETLKQFRRLVDDWLAESNDKKITDLESIAVRATLSSCSQELLRLVENIEREG